MENKRLKIAFFNISQGAVSRGAETFVDELGKRLRVNHKVDILSDKKILPQRWPILWRTFLDPPGLSVLLFTLRNTPKILRERYDIVFAINGGWQPAIIRIITLLYGGKLIISGQSGKGWDDKNNLWNFPDAFVALSSHLKNWAKKVNPFVRVKYIPNGVDLVKFKPQGQKVNFDLEKPIILCVGALTDEKRIELAIKAVAGLPGGSLVIIGRGGLKDRLTSLGNELLKGRFLITSATHGDIPKYYRGADLMTIPSHHYRSFEIVLVEAMASNLPVVANDDPIRQEIVGDGGLLVNPENTEEYTKVLTEALGMDWDNKPRRQAGKFSWDKIAAQYELLFEELI